MESKFDKAMCLEKMKNAVEVLSGGQNTVILDDLGNPSVMVWVPKFRICDVLPGGSDKVHPAFIVNGKEIDGIYVSKYQNVIYDERAYSLPYENPTANLTFDEAVDACSKKGKGWHLMSNVEWAAIALWCRAHNCMPLGNNNNGSSLAAPFEAGIPGAYDAKNPAKVTYTLTGSGPKSWAHNREWNGIYDLHGNVSEMIGGYRAMDGELQVIPNNDTAGGADQSADSPCWKAILEDGSLVEPGTDGTLKWDYIDGVPEDGAMVNFKLSKKIVYQQKPEQTGQGRQRFSELTVDDSIKEVPEYVKALALFPNDKGMYSGDCMAIRNAGERMSCRGGAYFGYGLAGVFFIYTRAPRTMKDGSLGFRSAYVPQV